MSRLANLRWFELPTEPGQDRPALERGVEFDVEIKTGERYIATFEGDAGFVACDGKPVNPVRVLAEPLSRYLAVSRVARALLFGHVVSANEVTASNGLVMDWRTAKCGERLLMDGDAFDAAEVFVRVVGEAEALAALGGQRAPVVSNVAPVSAFASVSP